MWSNPQFPYDFITFTKEIHNVKLHFLWIASCLHSQPVYFFETKLTENSKWLYLLNYVGMKNFNISIHCYVIAVPKNFASVKRFLAKFRYWYKADLSELINFYSPEITIVFCWFLGERINSLKFAGY